VLGGNVLQGMLYCKSLSQNLCSAVFLDIKEGWSRRLTP
jgi:hypothetical protein